MQRTLISMFLFFCFAATAAAQIGKSVSVAAGTPEDKALSEIYAAPDGPDKIALLAKFMEEFGKGDLELLGDQLYEQSYLTQKNYAKVYEYGEKALALDPTSLSSVVNMVHAADEQGDTQKLFALAEKAAAIVAKYTTAAAPGNIPPDMWANQKAENLKNAQADLAYIQYALVNAAYKAKDPATRAALFERYIAIFPESPYSADVREKTAFSYQQAQNTPKMLAAAQSVLDADPNNISMLIVLADYWSEKGQQLDKASADAQKALDLLGKATKPDNLTDDQWQQQISLQKGLAYSSLGEIAVNNNENPQAVDAFKKAGPLLKSDTFSYARNQYRLGFTLAKMKRTPEARVVLTEVISLNSPYKALAQEALDKIGGKPTHKAGNKPS